MFWSEKKKRHQDKKLQSSHQNLQKVKRQSKIEREALKRFRQDLHAIDIHEEQLIEQERTTLTEEELAKTVQVDIEGVNDIEEFITKNLTPHEKTKKPSR